MTAREALFEIRRLVREGTLIPAALEHPDKVFDSIGRIAKEGLDRTQLVNFELSDLLADRFAVAYRLLEQLREGGDVATLSGEIDEALALPPDLEAMVDRRR